MTPFKDNNIEPIPETNDSNADTKLLENMTPIVIAPIFEGSKFTDTKPFFSTDLSDSNGKVGIPYDDIYCSQRFSLFSFDFDARTNDEK